jgi:putative Mg2+ transporter-C (MgtC) family protein
MAAGTFSPIYLSWVDILARIGAALVFSLALGVERFLRKKPIDFRPFVIIALASCTLVLSVSEYGVKVNDTALAVDPSRVVQGVLTGIGFLGAGALFREDYTVYGAGSATSIWAAGAIGLICGFGLLWLAGLLSIGLLLVLGLSRPFTGDYTIRIDQDDGQNRDKS